MGAKAALTSVEQVSQGLLPSARTSGTMNRAAGTVEAKSQAPCGYQLQDLSSHGRKPGQVFSAINNKTEHFPVWAAPLEQM